MFHSLVVSTVVVVLVAAAVFFYLALRGKQQGITAPGSGVSAFAKVAEIEGKLIAAKVTAAAKKEEAKAVHALLDEVNSLLG